MNPTDPSSNDITRRSFMKKSALTVGAITLLGQGIGLADGTGSGSGACMATFTDTATGIKGKCYDGSMEGNTAYYEEYERKCTRSPGGHTLGKFRKTVNKPADPENWTFVANPPTEYSSSLPGSGSDGHCYNPI